MPKKKPPPPRLPTIRLSHSSVSGHLRVAHSSVSRPGPHVVRRPEASATTRPTATTTAAAPRPRPPPPPQPPRRPPALLALEKRAREVLGLKARFSVTDLRKAFRTHVKTSHPDQGGDVKRFRVILSAYRFLSSHALATSS
jgi:hypothetical protein